MNDAQRSLGLLGATGVGVGAIVGGGILALAGVAFAATGPGALLAFSLNGAIALLTALSFAEMAASFPESGGTYTFAKKVLSVETAFMVGWVVWFASIVAAVLYALGFAAYGVIVADELWQLALGTPPDWLGSRIAVTALAILATLFYTWSLSRSAAGGGQGATIGKVIVFLILIAGGSWVLFSRPAGTIPSAMSPFLPNGTAGLFQAMGYTFIALQGFDLIAAVGGEVRSPGRNLPRAMLLSLAAALAIYLPLLLIIATVGMPEGRSVLEVGAENPETIVAVAAERFLGPWGYWLVLVAAVLSMLSALQANLLASSRIAMSMARDRTLPSRFGSVNERHGTPLNAVLLTAGAVLAILFLISDVAVAGAVSSLIFLITFALAHWTNILLRRRGGVRDAPFRLPFFPLIPGLGMLCCVLLAIFQGFSVPSAGVVAVVWLGLGAGLYLTFFADRARAVDASAEARDPELVRLRGRNPLVLVPIANPASAQGLVEVANALAPRDLGRVMLLSVVKPPEEWTPGHAPQQLIDAQSVLGESLTASFSADLAPEALITVSDQPWDEICRISSFHDCESLLLGFGKLSEELMGDHLEHLMSTVDSHVVLLRAAPGFCLSNVKRILVPVGGRRDQSRLRARLLGSLCRMGDREIVFLGAFSEDTPQEVCDAAEADLNALAHDEAPGHAHVRIVRGSDVAEELIAEAAGYDLVLMGLQRLGARRKSFGKLALKVTRETSGPLLMISRRG